MAKMIDLGKKMDSSCCSPASEGKKGESKLYYPSLYISGVEGLDLSTGEITFTAKGKVVSVSRRETEEDGEKYSCEIEVHSISAPGAKPEKGDSGTSLEKSLEDISSKKKEVVVEDVDEEADDE